MAEEQFFYRFRTLKNIFEYKELENLEIYFASNEELNDPMEAYKTVIFQGDNIMWHNLFKNYILCLSRFMLANQLKGNPEELIQISSFNILNPFDDFQYTQLYYDLFNGIYKTFREHFTEDINNIFKENDKVTAEALKVYLLILNLLILEIIGSHLYKTIINDYCAQGNDGFKILNQPDKIVEKYAFDATTCIKKILKNSTKPIDIKDDNRITIVKS